MSTDPQLKQLLNDLADRYETSGFIIGDPSFWMHQVTGDENKEATAFVASSLSYGSRKQFMPKIETLLTLADGDMDKWIRNKQYTTHFRPDDSSSFYRLYSHTTMRRFLDAYHLLMQQHDTLGVYVEKQTATADGFGAVETICHWFASHGDGKVVPRDACSACKRICMFLRWMCRNNSPVDIGLWSSFIDRRTLIMPLDTHVVHEAHRLGLTDTMTTSMSAAIRLTATMSEYFPDDPLRADYALFGLGIEQNK